MKQLELDNILDKEEINENLYEEDLLIFLTLL